jgi:cardiolipin synthase
VRLLHDGEEALPAMLEAIRSARHEVLLEMYWFDSDRTGRRFAEALMAKARKGVWVRVIYDALGSIEADSDMFDAMRAAGCEVFEFHPIAPFRPRFSFARINKRDHRKLIVIDGRLAITGGINLGDPWAPRHEGGAGFRDDAIAITGAAALELRALFYRVFPAPPHPLPAPVPVQGDCEVIVLANDLHAERRDIYDGYINAIARASRDIIISNSYFIPARRVRRALKRAVERGVRVRVLVPKRSDVLLAQYASRAKYEELLSNGVEIYEWPGRVLHTKSAVVDDRWCTVGSFNFDALSIHNNLELNVAIVSREVTKALRTRMEEDLARAERVDLDAFQRRALTSRLLERFCHFFRWTL